MAGGHGDGDLTGGGGYHGVAGGDDGRTLAELFGGKDGVGGLRQGNCLAF